MNHNNIYTEKTKAIVAMNKAKGEASKLNQENFKLNELLRNIEDVCKGAIYEDNIESHSHRTLGWIFLQIKQR